MGCFSAEPGPISRRSNVQPASKVSMARPNWTGDTRSVFQYSGDLVEVG